MKNTLIRLAMIAFALAHVRFYEGDRSIFRGDWQWEMLAAALFNFAGGLLIAWLIARGVGQELNRRWG